MRIVNITLYSFALQNTWLQMLITILCKRYKGGKAKYSNNELTGHVFLCLTYSLIQPSISLPIWFYTIVHMSEIHGKISICSCDLHSNFITWASLLSFYKRKWNIRKDKQLTPFLGGKSLKVRRTWAFLIPESTYSWLCVPKCHCVN